MRFKTKDIKTLTFSNIFANLLNLLEKLERVFDVDFLLEMIVVLIVSKVSDLNSEVRSAAPLAIRVSPQAIILHM